MCRTAAIQVRCSSPRAVLCCNAQLVPPRQEWYSYVALFSSRDSTESRSAIDFFFYKKLKNVSCEYDRVNG